MSAIRGGIPVAADNASTASWLERYAWTVFLFLSAILLLFGVSDLPGATSSTELENAINELFIGCLAAAIAFMGLRRRQRWAWYAMALWPLWIAAQALRAASIGKTGEMWSAVFLLVVALIGLALAYRPTHKTKTRGDDRGPR